MYLIINIVNNYVHRYKFKKEGKKISNQQKLDLEAVLKDGASSILAATKH